MLVTPRFGTRLLIAASFLIAVVAYWYRIHNWPVALDGYCPVVLVHGDRWLLGEEEHRTGYRGNTYHFAGPAEERVFKRNPRRYAPVLRGCDIIELVENDAHVPGERCHGVVFQKRIFLFHNEANLQQFAADPEDYCERARLPQAIVTGESKPPTQDEDPHLMSFDDVLAALHDNETPNQPKTRDHHVAQKR